MYNTILFDLDGTVIDSVDGVLNSVCYALDKMNIEPLPRERMVSFMGPPLFDSFRDLFGLSPEDCGRAIDHYRVYYRERGIHENRVYGGIPQLLEELCSRGKRLLLATSKPEGFARQILEELGLAHLFHMIAGASFDGSRSTKVDVIRYAFESIGLAPPYEGALMVGDRHFDIDGARAVGIHSAGVLFGYGTIEELTSAGATYIVPTPLDLLKFV